MWCGRLIVMMLAAPGLIACAGSDAVVSSQPASNVTGSVGNTAANRQVATVGVLGNGFGSVLDERDHQRAFAAEVQALEQGEPGEPVGWRGAAGRSGTVVPGAPYETRGTRCRDYSHTIFMDGKPQTARASACRNPDGSWTPSS
jgi:surface antigen